MLLSGGCILEKSVKQEFRSAFRLSATVKGMIIGFNLLLSFILYGIVISQGNVNTFLEHMNNMDNWGALLFNFSVSFLTVLCPVVFFFGFKKKGWFRSEVFSKRPSFTETGASVGYSVVFVYFCQIVGLTVIQMLLSLIGKSLPQYEMRYPTDPWMILMLCVVIAVLPALSEEFCVRGAVLSSLKQFGIGFASLISAFVFMMLHNTVAQLPLAFSAGLAFAFCTFKFRSIWPAVVAHFVVNLNSCILALIFFMPSGNLRGFVFLAYVFLFFALIGSLLLMGMIVHGFRLPKYEKPSAETKKMRRKLLFTTPSVYVFLSLFLLMLILNFIEIMIA